MKKPKLRKISAYRYGQENEWIEASGWAVQQTSPGEYCWSIVVDNVHNVWAKPTFHKVNIRFDDTPISIEEEYFDDLYNTVKSLLHEECGELDHDCAQAIMREIDGHRLLEEWS